MPIKGIIDLLVANYRYFSGEGFYGNVVQGLVIKQCRCCFHFGIAIDGTLIFRKRNYQTFQLGKTINSSNN